VAEIAGVKRLYWTSFAIRFSLGMVAWICTEYFKISIMEDAALYSKNAAATAQAWISGTQAEWLEQAMADGKQAWLMVYVLAVFYLLSAGVEVVPLALACYCLLTSWTPVLAYKTSRQLGMTHRAAMIAGALIAYTPAFAIWSGAMYKEGLILIATYLVMLHGLRLQSDPSPGSIVVLVFSFVALFGLRFYMGTILMGALALGLLLGKSDARSGQGMPPIFRQLILLGLLLFIFSLVGLSGKADKMLSADWSDSFEQIDTSRRDLAVSSRSGYLRDADVSTPAKALGFLPIGLVYFLTVPLPWHISTFRQNITIPETAYWILLVYPRMIRGIGRGWKNNFQGTLFLLLAAVVVTCFYAIFVGNIGVAYRMRIQVWAIAAIFAGWGWDRAASIANRPSAVGRPIRTL
jgi:hypothetical protein